MFDITSTLKKFFVIDESAVEIRPLSQPLHLRSDSLAQASQDLDIYASFNALKPLPSPSSCNHPYYFFEQEHRSSLPGYLMQEASFEEKTHPESSQMLKILGDKVQGQGICKQSQTGLVYLDISADYLTDLALFFAPSGGTLPQLQAHIAVISPEEAVKAGINLEEEIGSFFSFSITECSEIRCHNWKGVENVWVLKAYSEELEELRKKLGLCPRIHGNAFNILLSLKPSSKTAPHQDFFRVSPTISGV